MKKLADFLLDILGRLPTTNARIAVTLICVLATTAVYMVSALMGKTWDPSWDWLGFLVMMSGLDAAQFFAKRKTHDGKGTPEDPTPEPPANG